MRKSQLIKRIVSLSMISLLSLSAVFAGGNTESANTGSNAVEIRIATWTSNPDQIALLTSFVNEFAEKEGVTINPVFESILYDEYNTKLSLELQSSSAPDVYWVLESSAPTFIQSGLLAPLNEAMAEYDADDFSAPAMELWKSGDTVYAIPFSTSPFFLVYNADLFEQAGVENPKELYEAGNWTWDKFREVSKEIKDKTGVYAYQTVDGQGYGARVVQNLIMFVRSYGGDIYGDDGSVLINTPGSIQGVQLFHDMVYVDKSIVPPGDQSDFFAGNAAMTVAQISRLSKLDGASFSWGVAPVPAGPDGDAPIIGQAAIGVNAKGKNVELASKLVSYMTNKDCVARMAGIWPPARKSVLESEEFLTSNSMLSPEDMSLAVAGSIEIGRVLPSHVQWPQIEVEARMVYDKLWNSNADVKAILDEVAGVYSKYAK